VISIKQLMSQLSTSSAYPEYYKYSHIEELETKSTRKLFRYFKGHWYVFPEQKQQIINNIEFHKPWKPASQFRAEVNWAGIPIQRKEAIANALSKEEEQHYPDHIAVGYHLDSASDSWYQNNHISQVGKWQFVPTIPGPINNFLGFRPNPNWLPYNSWFRQVHDILIEKIPESCISEIFQHFKWRESNITIVIERNHSKAVKNRKRDLKYLKRAAKPAGRRKRARIKLEEE
jgi:hypothetical protein